MLFLPPLPGGLSRRPDPAALDISLPSALLPNCLEPSAAGCEVPVCVAPAALLAHVNTQLVTVNKEAPC